MTEDTLLFSKFLPRNLCIKALFPAVCIYRKGHGFFSPFLFLKKYVTASCFGSVGPDRLSPHIPPTPKQLQGNCAMGLERVQEAQASFPFCPHTEVGKATSNLWKAPPSYLSALCPRAPGSFPPSCGLSLPSFLARCLS